MPGKGLRRTRVVPGRDGPARSAAIQRLHLYERALIGQEHARAIVVGHAVRHEGRRHRDAFGREGALAPHKPGKFPLSSIHCTTGSAALVFTRNS